MHKGILCSIDSLPAKAGCSCASFALMRAITFCLFSFTVFSQLTTCSNSTNCYTSLFFFFASSFTATLHQTCWKALHLKSCIVDRSYVLFVILSIVVLYEFLCKHCFISRDCYIARSIFLFYTAAFAKGVLFPTSHYFFFFWFRHAWPWLHCPWCSFLFSLFGDRQFRMTCLTPLRQLWAVSKVPPSNPVVCIPFHQLCSAS